MSGHGLIYEWADYDIGTLKKILWHLNSLDRLGFHQDEDLLYSIQEEISRRRKEK